MKTFLPELSRRADDAAETSARLPWPAAMLIIFGLSLLLWGVVAYGLNALIG